MVLLVECSLLLLLLLSVVYPLLLLLMLLVLLPQRLLQAVIVLLYSVLRLLLSIGTLELLCLVVWLTIHWGTDHLHWLLKARLVLLTAPWVSLVFGVMTRRQLMLLRSLMSRVTGHILVEGVNPLHGVVTSMLWYPVTVGIH